MRLLMRLCTWALHSQGAGARTNALRGYQIINRMTLFWAGRLANGRIENDFTGEIGR
jgi:hypothetical protein